MSISFKKFLKKVLETDSGVSVFVEDFLEGLEIPRYLEWAGATVPKSMTLGGIAESLPIGVREEVVAEFYESWRHWCIAKCPGIEVSPVEGFLYVLKVPGKDLFKIGRSTNGGVYRLRQLRGESQVRGLYVYTELKSIYYACMEKEIHTILAPYRRVGGEWFKVPEARVLQVLKYYEGFTKGDLYLQDVKSFTEFDLYDCKYEALGAFN